MAKMSVFLLDGYQFERLIQIEKELFGNGSLLSPDKRRDLANRLHLLTNEVHDSRQVIEDNDINKIFSRP